ncbi:MAG: hypothetical protein MUF49_12125 [Oculatellaceae cyanobacterium Prado106]|jgi:hypothetical protein|nr:hypothetical protein [Oculatellaceae cyanobacterium Prado106]
MNSASIQLDPLNSPHPIPWNWVTAMVFGQPQPDATQCFYRSPSLISPDGRYAAYSRIQVQLADHFLQARVSSVLFLENLETGSLQTLLAASPFAENPFKVKQGIHTEDASTQPGTIAVLIPIAWSEGGDRLLAREFESFFGSDLASDFAVVWDRHSNETYTLSPSQIHYTNAILMGWSQVNPDQVLFQAGVMGVENWPFYTVNLRGETAIALADQPVTYGSTMNHVWAGPQASVC